MFNVAITINYAHSIFNLAMTRKSVVLYCTIKQEHPTSNFKRNVWIQVNLSD